MPTTLGRIVTFLRDIGLTVQQAEVPDDAFLPGIFIKQGRLFFDPDKLMAPGDLLHEAGHLAVLPRQERERLTGNVGDGYELAAIAWSYAACVHLDLPAEVVFHAQGYKGEADSLIENFTAGRYVGVPILVWRGMTRMGEASSPGEGGYPAMSQWLCD